jgi:hypothetical protein
MKELCVEGLASHDDPGSCAGVREGAGEALAGVRAGGAIESRNVDVRGADAVSLSGRQHRRQRHRELAAGPARSENLCMRGTSGRENRQIPWLPVGVIAGRAAQGRLRLQA